MANGMELHHQWMTGHWLLGGSGAARRVAGSESGANDTSGSGSQRWMGVTGDTQSGGRLVPLERRKSWSGRSGHRFRRQIPERRHRYRPRGCWWIIGNSVATSLSLSVTIAKATLSISSSKIGKFSFFSKRWQNMHLWKPRNLSKWSLIVGFRRWLPLTWLLWITHPRCTTDLHVDHHLEKNDKHGIDCKWNPAVFIEPVDLIASK